MSDCGCTHEAPCSCDGCREKHRVLGMLYDRIDELGARLKESMELNAKATRH